MLSVFGRERFWRESKAVYSAAGFCGSGWVDGWAGLDIKVARHQISINSGSCGKHETVPPFECGDMHTLVTKGARNSASQHVGFVFKSFTGDPEDAGKKTPIRLCVFHSTKRLGGSPTSTDGRRLCSVRARCCYRAWTFVPYFCYFCVFRRAPRAHPKTQREANTVAILWEIKETLVLCARVSRNKPEVAALGPPPVIAYVRAK